MKLSKFSKIIILFLLSLGIVFTIIGCKQPLPEDTAKNYLSLWQQSKYKEMYHLLSPKATAIITENDFIKKYQSIYAGIGLTRLTYTPETLKKEKDLATLPFTATYTTMAGEMKNRFLLPLVRDKKGWGVEWTPALIFPQMTDGDFVMVSDTLPTRGEIFDREGNPLAINGYACTVYARPTKIKDAAATSEKLAPIIGLKPADILQILQSKQGIRDNLALIKSFPQGEITSEQEQQIIALTGIGIDRKTFVKIRQYPGGALLSHALGYTGVISEQQLKEKAAKGYEKDQRIGKSGLEQAYEEQLVGKKGYEIYIADKNKKKKIVLASSPKEDGLDLHLTIDRKLQLRAEELLKGQTGTVVVLDPASGEVLTMASSPSFDPNDFSFKMSDTKWKQLQDIANGKPLFNRITQGLYPPGSTMKPFTASMGLESGKITPEFIFPGKVVDQKWIPENEKWPYPPITRVPHPDGPVTLEKAIMWSDNTYFAYTALAIGLQPFQDYATRYGFGQAMPFDLTVSGSRLFNKGTAPTRKLLADSGYGQGELLITPLQMAVTFSAFSNGGSIMNPLLVKSFYQTQNGIYKPTKTIESTPWKKDIILQNTLQTLLPDLKKVISDPAGTAYKANVPGMDLAAKTGTAEIGGDKAREIAWFIGFTNGLNPNKLICITLEVPANQGTEIKLNIAKQMLMP